jgi:hypothetical protein
MGFVPSTPSLRHEDLFEKLVVKRRFISSSLRVSSVFQKATLITGLKTNRQLSTGAVTASSRMGSLPLFFGALDTSYIKQRHGL